MKVYLFFSFFLPRSIRPKSLHPSEAPTTQLMFHAVVDIGFGSPAEMMKLGVKTMVIYTCVCDLLERKTAHSITPPSTSFVDGTQIKLC